MNVPRAATELAKLWRTDRMLRRLESVLIVVDARHSLLITGSGDVIQPSDGILATGSGGGYALAAARALLKHSELSAAEVVRESLAIASGIDIYTNSNLTVEELPCQITRARTRADTAPDRGRARPRHRRPGRRQAGRRDRAAEPMAPPAAFRRAAPAGHAQEHHADRARPASARPRSPAGWRSSSALRSSRPRPPSTPRSAMSAATSKGLIRDLVEAAIILVQDCRAGARSSSRPASKSSNGCSICSLPPPPATTWQDSETPQAAEAAERRQRSREKMKARLEAGELEDREVEITFPGPIDGAGVDPGRGQL